MKELRRAKPERPKGLYNDRAADNWRLLFAIADMVEGKWPEKARAVALALTVDEDDAAVQTRDGIVALVLDRHLTGGDEYTEHELRTRFSPILPLGRIGGIISKLVEAGELKVKKGFRAPHRLLVPGGDDDE